MSNETRRKVLQALTETCVALERAMRYSPEFRDMPLIAFYEGHIAKLKAMLAN